MGKKDLILQAIKMGVSAPKIIAKYGKKFYNKAKADMKEMDRVDIANKEWSKPIDKYLTKKKKEKRATIREEARKPKKKITSSKIGLQKRGLRSGATVNSRAIAKKYFKGGMA